MDSKLVISLLALFISIFSLVTTLFFNIKDHERRRKQATIEYFEAMTNKLFEVQAKFNDKISALNIEIYMLDTDPSLLKDATEILSAFERLSVGVNAKIFDFDILDRMCGSYLIFLYSRFSPYIEKIRKDASRINSYKEFENLVYQIKKKRNPLDRNGQI